MVCPNAIERLEDYVEALQTILSQGVGKHRNRSIRAARKRMYAYLIDACGYSIEAAGQACNDAVDVARLNNAAEE